MVGAVFLSKCGFQTNPHKYKIDEEKPNLYI